MSRSVAVLALVVAGCGSDGSAAPDGGAAEAGPLEAGPGDDAAASDPLEDVARAYASGLDRLRGPVVDELRRVAGMREVAGSFATFLEGTSPSPASAARTSALTLYFTGTRELARGVVEGDFAGARAGLSGTALDAEGRDYRPEPRATWDEEHLLALSIDELALIAYALDHPDLSADDVEQIARDLGEALRPGLEDPDGFVESVVSRVSAAAREARRAMRWVKAEVILARDGFNLFDNLSYPGTPDLVGEHGFGTVKLWTSWYFFPWDAELQAYQEMDQVHEDIIRARVDGNLTGEETGFIVLDIENWPLEGDAFADNLDKMAQVADIVHDQNPSVVLGYYRFLPRRDPNAAYAGPDSDAYRAWEEHNLAVAAVLAPRVDVLFPSLYTIHEGEDLWMTYAAENVRQARLVAAVRDPEVAALGPGFARPVLPYVWPQYHPNGGRNLRGLEFIEGDVWLHQLELLHELADGIVVWGSGADYPWDPAWEREGGWWSATVTFLSEIRDQGP